MRDAKTAGMALLVLLLGAAPARPADEPTPLKRGVRGLATRAPGRVSVDGKLDEWSRAFCTPVHYNHALRDDRPAQFLAMWDDRAFYLGLRALDRHKANPGDAGSLWNGDSVEFYFDARPGEALRGKDWTRGAIHLFFTPFEGSAVRPRWAMRGGIATSDTKLEGVEIAATAADWGYEVEFALPWANFPDFAPRPGALLAIDAELCSGDGGPRVDRTFAYGSPLSVQQPASLGAVELVEAFDPSYLREVGPATFPLWVETPWTQGERARARATVAIPPALIDEVGEVEVRLHDADGEVVGRLPAAVERFGPEGLGFARAIASWSIDDHPPGAYFATARVASRGGKTLARVAPRMVHEAQMSGR